MLKLTVRYDIMTNVKKCQAADPTKCRDEKCPNKLSHLINMRRSMVAFEELSKTLEAETEGENWDDYYSNLLYTLTHPQPYKEILETLTFELDSITEEEKLLESSIMNGYYETGETGNIDPKVLGKLSKLSERKKETQTLINSILIEHYASYEGASELREKIRELKNQYPKPRPAILEHMKYFHDSENFHKKQILAALITDAHKKTVNVEHKLLTELNKITNPEDKKFLKQWLKETTTDYFGDKIHNAAVASSEIVGFRKHVDIDSLDYKGKWFTVLYDEGMQLNHAEVPEKLTTIINTVPDLTLFKETLVGELVVLRRLKKRGLASQTELDLLKKVEYNNRRLAEFKKLGN
jgi:hypothetical protein